MGRRGNDPYLLTAAGLGAIAGLRSMAAPALLAQEFEDADHMDEFGPLERVFTSEATANILTMLAGSEMVMDKTHFVPDRTNAIPLIGRAVMGCLTAAAFAVQRRRPLLLPAAVGAASAVAATFAAYHLRRLATERLELPDRLLGLLEDAVVVAASRAVMGRIEE
jgi:uncharacterized membrane protein